MKKIALSLILLLFCNPALAQNVSKKEVETFIGDMGARIIKIATSTAAENVKKDKIITEIDNVIDSDWIARFVLGKNYRTASDTQRDRFAKIYRQFMINTYGPKFKNYNGKKFNVLSSDERNGFFVVKCTFLPKDSNTPIDVAFRVKSREGKLVVLDFIAEGVSLIETQRSEFNAAISQKGMDQFLKDLQVRVDNLKKQK